jgi:hypothetical protein
MRRIVSRLRLAIKHELSASRGRRRVRYENHWVAEGVLHWEEMVEPFEAPSGNFLGTKQSTTHRKAKSGGFEQAG